jgi:hypothetical protein
MWADIPHLGAPVEYQLLHDSKMDFFQVLEPPNQSSTKKFCGYMHIEVFMYFYFTTLVERQLYKQSTNIIATIDKLTLAPQS